MKKKYILFSASIGAIILLAVVAVVTVHHLTAVPVLPASIRREFGHTLLTPSNRSVTFNPHAATYDAGNQLLTFHVRTQAGGNTTINEQPVPSAFASDPTMLDNLTKSMGEYQHIETALGTVHLTQPNDLERRQVAVLDTGGTLIFVYPTNELNELQWRQFFDAMKLTSG